MIIDLLEQADRYLPLNKGFAKAVKFLRRPDLCDLPIGRYEIDGRRIYAVVAKDQGRKKTGALLETHDRYVDIQLILAGTDEMGWKPKSACRHPAGDYDEDADIRFYNDAPEVWVPVRKGCFVVFFPEDAHMPLISPGQIHKVVMKIAMDQA